LEEINALKGLTRRESKVKHKKKIKIKNRIIQEQKANNKK
jgi:hypothetical protein